jgi:branched-chain amino acid transport system ATP-binding protein
VNLTVRKLCAWHDQLQVLWDIDLDVAEGEIVGVLGRNGAGKTTLLRALSRLHEKAKGAIALDGRSVMNKKAHQVAREGVALVRDGGKLPSSLSVLQVVELGQSLARKRGKTPRTFDEIWRWFPILEPLQERKTGLLSGGQRQALALAAAFSSRPGLLLLDEPSAGLAPPVARELFSTIRMLASEELTVVVVEQHAAWLENLVERAYLFESGRIQAKGRLSELMQHV